MNRFPSMLPWLAAVVAVDLAISAYVIRRVLRKRIPRANGENSPTVFTLDIRALRQFTQALHPRIGDYVRANWSGIPDDLPPVLEHLLGELETEARARFRSTRRITYAEIATSTATTAASHGSMEGRRFTRRRADAVRG